MTRLGKSFKQNGNSRTPGRYTSRTVEGNGICSDESTDFCKATPMIASVLQVLHGTNSRDKGNAYGGAICDFETSRGHFETDCFLITENPNHKLPPNMKERIIFTSAMSNKKPGKGNSRNKQEGNVELARNFPVLKSQFNATDYHQPSERSPHIPRQRSHLALTSFRGCFCTRDNCGV